MFHVYIRCDITIIVPNLFQALLNDSSSCNLVISKPKYSYRQKVVHAVIRSVGMCVRVCVLVKNITGMTTPVVKSKYFRQYITWEVVMLVDSEAAARVSGAAETVDYFG